MLKIGPIEALGTVWWFEVFTPLKETKAQEIEDLLRLRLQSFNNTYSRFNLDSVVSELNTHGELHNPSDELLTLLKLGQEYHQATAGIFNFLTGSNQEQNGYDTDHSFIASTESQEVANPQLDLEITPDRVLLHKGKVDLGGFGKGWLIDDLARTLKSHDVSEFLINGGGDLYGTSENDQPIIITLQHPFSNGLFIGSITLHYQALAASSPTLRTWQDPNSNRQYSHFINPTSTNTESRYATFVTSPSAADADMLATALSIEPHASVDTEASYLVIDSKNKIAIDHNFKLISLQSN